MNNQEQAQSLRITDVAAILRCSRTTVWRKVGEGKLPPPIKIGGLTRWRRADIEALFSTTE